MLVEFCHKFFAIYDKARVGAFAYYAEDLHKWTVNPGMFAIEICKNAHEILLSQRVEYGL